MKDGVLEGRGVASRQVEHIADALLTNRHSGGGGPSATATGGVLNDADRSSGGWNRGVEARAELEPG